MARKEPANWTAISAVVGILTLICAVGFGVYQVLQTDNSGPSTSIATTGNHSPVISGNKGNVNID